jgi:hypothetical protein
VRAVVASPAASALPNFAGNTWAFLQYVVGLGRLGVETFWVDHQPKLDPRRPVRDGRAQPHEDCHSIEYASARFDAMARDFGFEGRYCILYDGGTTGFGMGPEALRDLVDDPAGYHELVAPPNLPIPTVEHAIALGASSLIRDGGTVQLGIGELGDAIVHAMTLRHRENAAWKGALRDVAMLPRFEAEVRGIGGDGPFEQGLYAVTEMFVDGFLDLYRAGILKRRAGPDGALLHAAFLLGPRAFYESLRAMPDPERALFRMMPVSFTNELDGPG